MQSYAFSQERFNPIQSDYSSLDYMPDTSSTAMSYAPPYEYPSTQLPYYAYTEPDYTCWPGNSTAMQYHSDTPCTEPPLYAPIPVSGYTTLLVGGTHNAAEHTGNPAASFSTRTATANTPPDESKALPTDDQNQNPLDVYLDAPQVLFPTPSELLNDLTAREQASTRDSEPADAPPSPNSTAASSLGKRKRDTREKAENLNQRKAYFRAVSDNVGFSITDPDTITSHDKKRSYLECLEEYVQWLHEQIRLVGHEPIPLERISTYRGLKNRSLRTMLVHMQNSTSKLNSRKLQAERKFMELQNAVLVQQAAEESVQFRRHSVAMGAMPHGIIPSFVP